MSDNDKPNHTFAVLSLIVIILMVLCGLGIIAVAMPVLGNVIPLP